MGIFIFIYNRNDFKLVKFLKLMALERQVLYNVLTSTDAQNPARHTHHFIIVNRLDEYRKIQGRIFEQLQPVSDLVELDDGVVPNSQGVHKFYMSLKSPRGKINPAEVYKGEFRQDESLGSSGTLNDVAVNTYFIRVNADTIRRRRERRD